MKFKKAVLLNITEAMLDREYWQKLDELVENKVLVSADDPNLTAELADADCLLIIWGTKVDKAMMDSAPKLKYIGALATAYGGVDLDYAKSKDIVVTNIPGYATESVAEFVIAALLEHVRGLGKGLQAAKKGDFAGAGISARELKASKFGVIGLGEIGNRVAELANGFGAKVSYYNRSEKNVPFEKKN
jgi:lactate dehydrogenase-like 2-hydroxyacid dehydrogenase